MGACEIISPVENIVGEDSALTSNCIHISFPLIDELIHNFPYREDVEVVVNEAHLRAMFRNLGVIRDR